MNITQAVALAGIATTETRNRRGWTPAELATLKPPRPSVRFFAWKDSPDECLRNGSFLRLTKHGLAKYTLGDFQGYYAEVPPEYVEVPADHALALIPR